MSLSVLLLAVGFVLVGITALVEFTKRRKMLLLSSGFLIFSVGLIANFYVPETLSTTELSNQTTNTSYSDKSNIEPQTQVSRNSQGATRSAVNADSEQPFAESVAEANNSLKLSLSAPAIMSIPAGKQLEVAHLNCDVLVRFDRTTILLRKGTDRVFVNRQGRAQNLRIELLDNGMSGDLVQSTGIFAQSKSKRRGNQGCRAIYNLI